MTFAQGGIVHPGLWGKENGRELYIPFCSCGCGTELFIPLASYRRAYDWERDGL